MPITKYVPQQVLDRAATVAWSIGLSAITADALAMRNGITVAAAEEHLDDAVRLEMMEKKSILIGYSPLYIVTHHGRVEARKHATEGGYTYPLGIKTCNVAIGRARHTIACASVAAALERRYPDYQIIGELQLGRDAHAHATGRQVPGVSVQSPTGRRFHRPDLVIWPPSKPSAVVIPRPILIEVELTTKDREELTENCRAFTQNNQIEAVLYFCENTKVELPLLSVVEELKAEDKIVVNPLSEIVSSLPGFNLGRGEGYTTDH